MSIGHHMYTGISISYAYAGEDQWGWTASLSFTDAGFCSGFTPGEPISTEGTLRTRYAVRPGPSNADLIEALGAAVRAVVADADRMGIGWFPTLGEAKPVLFTDGPEWQKPWNDTDISKNKALRVVREFSDQWTDGPSADPRATIAVEQD